MLVHERTHALPHASVRTHARRHTLARPCTYARMHTCTGGDVPVLVAPLFGAADVTGRAAATYECRQAAQRHAQHICTRLPRRRALRRRAHRAFRLLMQPQWAYGWQTEAAGAGGLRVGLEDGMQPPAHWLIETLPV